MVTPTMLVPSQGQNLSYNLGLSRDELRLGLSHGFGDRLERAIGAPGIDKKDFAALMRVKPEMVSQWIAKGNPTMQTLVRMSRLLGVSIDWLAHGPQPAVDDVTLDELEALTHRQGLGMGAFGGRTKEHSGCVACSLSQKDTPSGRPTLSNSCILQQLRRY